MSCLRFFALGCSLAAWLVGSAAQAADLTFCIGGRDPRTGHSACEPAKYDCMHMLLIKRSTGECYECRDMSDNTCITEFFGNSKWRDVSSQFVPADPITCAFRKFAPATEIVLEVVAGEQVTTPPPPAPPRAELVLQPELSLPNRVRGPGEPLGLTARVRGPDGNIRPVTAAMLIVTGPDGKEKWRGPAELRPDGSVGSGTVKIPKEAGDYRVRLEVKGVTLGSAESLSGNVVGEQTFRVAPCVGMTSISSPSSGAALLSGESLPLVGGAKDGQGAPMPGGGPFHFVVRVADAPELKVAAARNGETFTAALPISLPQGVTQATAHIQLLDGSGSTCTGAPVLATVSELGVGLEIDARPAKCFVGVPCEIGIKVRTASAGSAAGKARDFLAASDLVAEARVGVEHPKDALRRDRADHYTLTFVPDAARATTVSLRLSRLQQRVEASRALTIRPPLELSVPAVLDFQEAKAGVDVCLPLDLAGSRGAEDQRLGLFAKLPDDCDANLLAELGEGRLPLTDPSQRFEALPWAEPESRKGSACAPGLLGYCVCLKPPLCGGVAPRQLDLTLAPVDLEDLTPEERSRWVSKQTRHVAVRFSVQGKTWLGCYFVYLCVAGGGVLGLVFVLGLTLPRGFGNSDFIRVAANAAKLPAAPRRRLRDLPGGRTGFYRSASVGLAVDGSHPRRGRAPIRFLPSPSGVRVELRGVPLKRVNPRTRELEPVAGQANQRSLSRASVYEAGGIYFELA
jgi:hypothetical protein